MKLLLVEDDEGLRKSLTILLKNKGYTVITASCGREGFELLEEDIDLVILDVMLPDFSGTDLCKMIRKDSNVPILFLTAKAGEDNEIEGLLAGGDDYITKPFSFRELSVRIQILIRRYRNYNEKMEIEEEPWIYCGAFDVSKQDRVVRKDGEEIRLTETEYKILRLLVEHPQKIYDLKTLHEYLWKEPMVGKQSSVSVHIRNLRGKIDPDAEIIENVWGKGYRYMPNEI